MAARGATELIKFGAVFNFTFLFVVIMKYIWGKLILNLIYFKLHILSQRLQLHVNAEAQ